jgi:hypothetical protein
MTGMDKPVIWEFKGASANKSGVYNFRCVCGANISTANPTGKCWDCGRSWELDADGGYDLPMKEALRP